MATVNPTITKLGGDDSVVKVAYDPLTNTNQDGAPFAFSQWADRSVQVVGTFGTNGSVRVQGSNDGGTTWAGLTDPQGNALDITAAKIEAITEVCELVRPLITAGDGNTSLKVYFVLRRGQPGYTR